MTQDGVEWREFKENLREDVLSGKKVGEKQIAPAFEDTMLIDLVRAMRRDRREMARRKPQKQQKTIDDLLGDDPGDS